MAMLYSCVIYCVYGIVYNMDTNEHTNITDTSHTNNADEGVLVTPPKAINVENVSELMQELLNAGVQFGHIKSAVHPHMFPYIFGTRNNVHIINVNSTIEKLDQAIQYLQQCKKENKTILFVGTKFPVRDLVKDVAIALKMPYITTYWPGGLLTNWDTIRTRTEKLKELEKLTQSAEWEKYTKQERSLMNKELDRLRERWEGIQFMDKVPDVMCIIDIQEDSIAFTEAKKKNIPVVGLVDTNSDPQGVDYPIPANDDAVSSVAVILNKIKSSL